jgi:metallo-beta-lactamase class B
MITKNRHHLIQYHNINKSMRYIITLLFAFLLSASFAQDIEKKLTVTQLTDDFYIYVTYQSYNKEKMSANGMYLVTNDGVVLFDTPWDTTQFQPLLDSILAKHHKKVVLCIATHSHEDRTAGLRYYKTLGIKTYTTKQTDTLCKERNAPRAQYTIENDSTFRVGQYSFQTYYAGPGHTPDNIVIWFAKEKIIYGGCLIKSIDAKDLGNLTDANVNEWPTTIKHIQHTCKNPSFIITGHQDWTNIKSLDHTLQLLKEQNVKN